ncbi:hypothetical protein [Streptomyces mobaraensis]|uniref:hypothetical protein n=1 Tax=Streptomyces mobaraensis TaxID=35621 RepID=UPI003408E8A1
MTLRAAAFLGVLSGPARGTAPSAAAGSPAPGAAGAGFFDGVVNSGKDALEAWKLEAAETVGSVMALRKPAGQQG